MHAPHALKRRKRIQSESILLLAPSTSLSPSISRVCSPSTVIQTSFTFNGIVGSSTDLSNSLYNVKHLLIVSVLTEYCLLVVPAMYSILTSLSSRLQSTMLNLYPSSDHFNITVVLSMRMAKFGFPSDNWSLCF